MSRDWLVLVKVVDVVVGKSVDLAIVFCGHL